MSVFFFFLWGEGVNRFFGLCKFGVMFGFVVCELRVCLGCLGCFSEQLLLVHTGFLVRMFLFVGVFC